MRYIKTLSLIMLLIAGGGVASADAVDDLVTSLTGDDNEARMDAADNAGSVGAAAVLPVGKLTADDDYLVTRAAKLALEKIVVEAGAPDSDDRDAVASALLKLVQPEQPAAARREAIHFLGWIGGPENVSAIAEYLTDPDIGDAARVALQRIPGEAVAEALIAAAPKVDDAVQPGIFYAVAERDDRDAIPILMEIAKSEDKQRAWMAFDVLTRLGVAPLQIIPQTHAKELADRKRYANGFLRAADVRLAQGDREEAERMYAAVAAFPVSPQHACAALIGLKNAQSPKLIEHALGYLLETGIRHAAKEALIDADIEGIDDYLMKAYGVTNAAKQRILLQIIAAREADGAARFLNEARHNQSAAVRFTAQRLLGEVPTADTFEAAFADAPLYDKDEIASTYFRLAVAEQRAGHADAARAMAHALIGPEIEPRVRVGAFDLIETAASADSAPVLRDAIGAAYQSAEHDQDPFEENRSLAIAAGRAYVAVLAAAARDDAWAIDELGNVAKNAFHAEVTNYATERLNEILGEAFNVSQ